MPVMHELAFPTTQGWFLSQAEVISGWVPSDLRRHVPLREKSHLFTCLKFQKRWEKNNSGLKVHNEVWLLISQCFWATVCKSTKALEVLAWNGVRDALIRSTIPGMLSGSWFESQLYCLLAVWVWGTLVTSWGLRLFCPTKGTGPERKIVL